MIALARIRKATAPKFPPLSSQQRATKNAILAATDRIVNATTLAEVRSALDANDVDSLKRMKDNALSPLLSLDKANLSGTFLNIPERAVIPLNANEQLVVELYSK